MTIFFLLMVKLSSRYFSNFSVGLMVIPIREMPKAGVLAMIDMLCLNSDKVEGGQKQIWENRTFILLLR